MSIKSDQTNDDTLVFADEHDPRSDIVPVGDRHLWKVMIADDDPNIHEVTKLALSDFEFYGRGIEFISAMSGAEAKTLILEHPDTAILLLDVVMENDHAGLDVAKYVREVAKNSNVRIVLRTGQPGQAPERQVITEYDINDYKEKTELTASKLFTLMYSSLRSYRDIIALEANKLGLEHVIEASSNIFELQSMQNFTRGVLEQITSLLHLENDAGYFKVDGLAAAHENNEYKLIAGIGAFENLLGEPGEKILPPEVLEDFDAAMTNGQNHFLDDRFTGYYKSSRGSENLVHLRGVGELTALDKSLLEVFSNNVGVAFDNVELNQDLEETQREIVYLLGEAVETRSQETGNHVKRVAEISRLLALDYGMDRDEAEMLRLASPMHDVGKIGIPDAILNKPGPHTPEETKLMQTHGMLGYEMLKHSKRRMLQAGAIIARAHHEKWDGTGYPIPSDG